MLPSLGLSPGRDCARWRWGVARLASDAGADVLEQAKTAAFELGMESEPPPRQRYPAAHDDRSGAGYGGWPAGLVTCWPLPGSAVCQLRAAARWRGGPGSSSAMRTWEQARVLLGQLDRQRGAMTGMGSPDPGTFRHPRDKPSEEVAGRHTPCGGITTTGRRDSCARSGP